MYARGRTMTAIHFFETKSDRIARNCSVIIEGLTITIHGIWTGNTARYSCRSTAELRIIRGILAQAGTVVAEITL